MKTEQVLHMVSGAGVNSYATNSTLQEKAVFRTKAIVEKTILDIINNKCPKNFVVADLGCSSGPNTLHFVAEVIDIIGLRCRKNDWILPEIQFFFNDLPKNDFNHLFRSLDEFETKFNNFKDNILSHYIAGVPGTFYGRLFPTNNVHFFYSNYCLHWLSQVPQIPKSRRSDVALGNIYISESCPKEVVTAYEDQYKKDFSTFLAARFVELSPEGGMVLTFLGRKRKYPQGGEIGLLVGLLADALNTMVLEGLLDSQKLESLYLPIHAATMEEVHAVIDNQGLFYINHFETFESNWDPSDDSEDDIVADCELSGRNAANTMRAVFEPIIKSHFGISDATIIDEIFSRYAHHISKHLQKEKSKYPIFVIVLKKKEGVKT